MLKVLESCGKLHLGGKALGEQLPMLVEHGGVRLLNPGEVELSAS